MLYIIYYILYIIYNLRELGLALLTSSWCLARWSGLEPNKMSSPGAANCAEVRSNGAAARRVHIHLLPYCISGILAPHFGSLFRIPTSYSGENPVSLLLLDENALHRIPIGLLSDTHRIPIGFPSDSHCRIWQIEKNSEKCSRFPSRGTLPFLRFFWSALPTGACQPGC